MESRNEKCEAIINASSNEDIVFYEGHPILYNIKRGLVYRES